MNQNTPLTSEDVHARVYLFLPGVVVLHGVPHSTPSAIDQLFAHAAELIGDHPAPFLIASLAEAGVPNAAARVRIKENIDRIGFTEIALVFENNTLVRVATRFILASLRVSNAQVFSTLEEACAAFAADPLQT